MAHATGERKHRGIRLIPVKPWAEDNASFLAGAKHSLLTILRYNRPEQWKKTREAIKRTLEEWLHVPWRLHEWQQTVYLRRRTVRLHPKRVSGPKGAPSERAGLSNVMPSDAARMVALARLTSMNGRRIRANGTRSFDAAHIQHQQARASRKLGSWAQTYG